MVKEYLWVYGQRKSGSSFYHHSDSLSNTDGRGEEKSPYHNEDSVDSLEQEQTYDYLVETDGCNYGIDILITKNFFAVTIKVRRIVALWITKMI